VTLRPEDIKAQQFRVVVRGYKVEEVDAFLERVRRELTPATGTEAAPASTPPEGTSAEGSHATTVDVTHSGDDALSARALRTLAIAQEMADKVAAAAAAEADQVLSDARVAADQVVAEAQAEAGAVLAELQVRRRREVEALEARVQQLRAETERLSQLERHCRESLQRWLAQQQLLVDPSGGIDGRAPEGLVRTGDHPTSSD
jgi:DivIVA domain-containing protein